MFQRIRGLTLDDFTKCAPCPDRAYCAHDRGAAFNSTGDYTGADPFVCASAEVAHALVREAELIPADALAPRLARRDSPGARPGRAGSVRDPPVSWASAPRLCRVERGGPAACERQRTVDRRQ